MTIYWLIAALLSLLLLMYTPSRLPKGRNLSGSILLALITGGVLWPLYATAAYVTWKRNKGSD